jgi:hypothetical protein
MLSVYALDALYLLGAVATVILIFVVINRAEV